MNRESGTVPAPFSIVKRADVQVSLTQIITSAALSNQIPNFIQYFQVRNEKIPAEAISTIIFKIFVRKGGLLRPNKIFIVGDDSFSVEPLPDSITAFVIKESIKKDPDQIISKLQKGFEEYFNKYPEVFNGVLKEVKNDAEYQCGFVIPPPPAAQANPQPRR